LPPPPPQLNNRSKKIPTAAENVSKASCAVGDRQQYVIIRARMENRWCLF
jgi:hypothetical protein